jgi:hypothetical protein
MFNYSPSRVAAPQATGPGGGGVTPFVEDEEGQGRHSMGDDVAPVEEAGRHGCLAGA